MFRSWSGDHFLHLDDDDLVRDRGAGAGAGFHGVALGGAIRDEVQGGRGRDQQEQGDQDQEGIRERRFRVGIRRHAPERIRLPAQGASFDSTRILSGPPVLTLSVRKWDGSPALKAMSPLRPAFHSTAVQAVRLAICTNSKLP